VPDSHSTIRDIAWRELCPWLILLRTFRLAVGCRVLCLSVAALIAVSAGWRLIGMVFSAADDDRPRLAHWIEDDSTWPWREPVALIGASLSGGPPGAPMNLAARFVSQSPLLNVWTRLTTPFRKLVLDDLTLVETLYLTLLCGWSLAVWALFGGAIVRICGLALAQEHRLSLVSAVWFASARWPAYAAAPILPVLGALVAVVPLFVVGVITRLDFLLALASFFWPLALLAGLLMAILLLGLAVGWPLMWAAIAVEETDSWDAVSRGYSYVFEHPLRLLFYVVVGTLFGILCTVLFNLVADAAYSLSLLPVRWGLGETQSLELDSLDSFGSRAIVGFWAGVVEMLKIAFQVGFFWANVAAIYLLMRRVTDSVEMDEISLGIGHAERQPPSLAPNAQGVPGV
jgi:hypothetical protein